MNWSVHLAADLATKNVTYTVCIKMEPKQTYLIVTHETNPLKTNYVSLIVTKIQYFIMSSAWSLFHYLNKGYARSCAHLKEAFGVSSDGDYNLNITKKIVSIYCHNMNSRQPAEFITLKSGESQNFAEIYEKR